MSDLAARYGAPRPGRRTWVTVLAVLLAVVGVAWVVWAALFHSTPEARSAMVAFRTPGEHVARATVTVIRADRDVRASCLLRASARDHSVVGELNFTVGPDRPETATVTKQIRTERKATAVELIGCTTSDQARRR
ncbi:MAG TPA: DUF4307 domain-containing protein [Nocardioidaceae bacterium]|nr:DUF4307 domain-containing protein [Nocardioidaceae bacterium]